jgi:hypothetical protein
MARFQVQALDRPGYDGSWRGGRKWLSSASTCVEVIDDDEDPKPRVEDEVLRIGKKTFKSLQDDQHLRVVPDGDPMALAQAANDVGTLRKELERLVGENARLQDELSHARGATKKQQSTQHRKGEGE